MVFDECTNAWTLSLSWFIRQVDGNNCGPIACLKLMELYHKISVNEIETSNKSFRAIVSDQYTRMIDDMSGQLIVNCRVKRMNINKDSDVLCVCVHPRHVSIQTKVQTCCNVTFHSQCLEHYLNTYGVCPFCKEGDSNNVTTNGPQNPPTTISAPQYPPMTPAATVADTNISPGDMGVREMSENDKVRAESIRKRRAFQDRQSEKMEERHAANLKQRGSQVACGSVVTLYIDARVASHARGVTAVVVRCNTDTGGIIACTAKGIVVNGTTRNVWWIAADGYKLQNAPGEVCPSLPPDLVHVQQQIIDGKFDSSVHNKCSLHEAHQFSVNASSPCKRSTCGCKNGLCSRRCGCVRGKRVCSSSCSCSGNCKINSRKTPVL